jgi:MFS family permease
MFGLVLVVGQLVDRAGRHRALIGGLVIMAISTVMLAWVVAIPAMSLSLFLLGLGWNVSYVAASAELVTLAKPVERGRLVGFTDLVAGLTAAALALLGGLAYSEWGVVAIAVGATVAVVAPAIVISLSRRPPAPVPEPGG